MSTTTPMPRERDARASVLVAFALFVLVGLFAGVNGVVLVAQMDDYGVGRATIGLTFFTFSAGFVLAGLAAGPLLHRWGARVSLVGGGVVLIAGTVATAARPPFVALVAVQLLLGLGLGMTETVLNAYLTARARGATLLNTLHGFFGVGALIGPVLAASVVRVAAWPAVLLVLAGLCVLLLASVLATYPARASDRLAATSDTHTSPSNDAHGPRLLPEVLRQRAVLLAALVLAVYVGLEAGVGSWAYAFLMDARSASDFVASSTVSLYWFGLTLGRFVLSPLATRFGLTKIGLSYGCLYGAVLATVLTWLAPSAVAAAAGFVLLGFFLGPVFPTTMAVMPDVTSARLAPTAMGVLNAGSVVGGSVLPWLMGAIGEGFGPWTLLPIALALALSQLLVWWRMLSHMDPSIVALRAAPSQARP
jgi:fucose permease